MTDNITHPYLQEYELDAAISYRAKRDIANKYNRNYMKTYYDNAEDKRIKKRERDRIWYSKKRSENPIFCIACNKYIQNLADHSQRVIHKDKQELYDAKIAKEAIEKEKIELSNKVIDTAKQLEDIVIEKKKLELKIDTMTIKPLEIIYESKKSKYSPRHLFSPKRSFA